MNRWIFLGGGCHVAIAQTQEAEHAKEEIERKGENLHVKRSGRVF